MSWDPATYLRFADHRSRPGVELLARVPDIDARHVIDLGCGAGDLTSLLARRWPQARVLGIDSSPEMLARAALDHPDVGFEEADITGYEPDGPLDLVFSNATLHWLDDHDQLFPRLRSWLRPGGVLAVQMPDNWREPTHTIPARILGGNDWAAPGRDALMRDRLASPSAYEAWVRPAGVDMWHTTYHQRLTGPDPVLAWVSGSVLRPVMESFDEETRRRFLEECRTEYRRAYPPGGDGITVLPFTRFFLVAVAE
jgi:trans-aconitate 2-methyltransferase